jgi:hypothetical protein
MGEEKYAAQKGCFRVDASTPEECTQAKDWVGVAQWTSHPPQEQSPAIVLGLLWL